MDEILQGTVSYFYHSKKREYFVASDVKLLRESAWIKSRNGKFISPNNLYLHELSDTYDTTSEYARQLLDFLGIKDISDKEDDSNLTDTQRKKIALADPYSIRVDTNNSFMNKRRKPKWVDRMISTKETTIINFKDKASSSDYGADCRIAPSIEGENYVDLQNKVENYLSELMKHINKNYCECPNCKGWGIVEVKE